jgi:uncharacterized protein YggE
MKRLALVHSLAAVAIWAVLAPAGHGQIAGAGAPADASAAVSGSGAVVLKRKPEILRMFVEISAKGKNLKEALDKLKDRRDAVEKRLAEIGADKDSIKIDSPKIPPVDPNRQRQLQQMVQMRMRERGKRVTKKPDSAKPVTVAVSVTADFPLSADDADGILLAAGGLEERIRKADLAGSKEKDEQSPEDEEIAEEAGEMELFGDPNAAKPGEPNFVFVAKISAEARAKALASAFEKAKIQAAQVAAAAGAKLGDLRRVSSQNYAGRGAYGGFEEAYAYQQMGGGSAYRRFLMQMQQTDAGETDADTSEAFGAQPGEVHFPLTVTAEFSLK